jgi:Heterokaryon incompatibility protein (HET)
MAYRYLDRPRILWADAICINQADTVDKNHQVATMADIYSKAKRVHAWLAPASHCTMEAIKFMSRLASKAESFEISDDVDQPRWLPDFPSVNICDDKAQNLISDAIKAHADLLVSLSWFNTVWIVQGVALAAELIVSCGHCIIDWTAFARALETLRGALRQAPLGEERSRLEGLKPAWELVRLRDNFRLADLQDDRNHHIMAIFLGTQMRNRGCSNDLDRVYLMLAMTKSPYPMTPDYEKTVSEAYTDFIRRYSPVKHIYLAGLCRRQHKSNPEDADTEDNQRPPIDLSDRDYLPSWVPEFRTIVSLRMGLTIQ